MTDVQHAAAETRRCSRSARCNFVDAKEDLLLIGPPGTGKSHCAKALALLAVQRGYKVLYREASAHRRSRRSARAGEICASTARN
ncbi:MAG: ATP-binding protein [Gemmatimonadaceae bacterium]|nr:ATP-binding protein [Gemmatimonadaceae bacterium]